MTFLFINYFLFCNIPVYLNLYNILTKKIKYKKYLNLFDDNQVGNF